MTKIFYVIIIIIIIVSSIFIIGSIADKDRGENIKKELFEEEEEDDDTIIIHTPTIDEIIKNGVPNDTSKYEEGIVYKTDNYYVVEDEVTDGQSISHILPKYNVSHTDIYKLEQASKGIFDWSKIQGGKPYIIICSQDSAKCFVYEKSEREYIVADLRDTIEVYQGKKEVSKKTNIVSGTIKEGGSLWISLSKKLGDHKSAPLVITLANSIYAWTIDFNRLQAEDSFIVYFEEEYVGENFDDIGKIFAVSFTHKGKIINAFRFNENEKYADYFDENGNNLRKAFLKTPIAYDFRISSNFGKRRHPISGKWSNHFGTDYAATTGTEIMSTANGTIDFAGRKGGYGKCVIVKHNSTYTTLYAHMSKIKSGIQKGAYVKQSDVIGFVGSTGYATGPHLHYEFWIDGKQVDPYKQELPPAAPLKEENKKRFEEIRDSYILKLKESVK